MNSEAHLDITILKVALYYEDTVKSTRCSCRMYLGRTTSSVVNRNSKGHRPCAVTKCRESKMDHISQ